MNKPAFVVIHRHAHDLASVNFCPACLPKIVECQMLSPCLLIPLGFVFVSIQSVSASVESCSKECAETVGDDVMALLDCTEKCEANTEASITGFAVQRT